MDWADGENLRLTFRQIKWTVCEKWKRNSEKIPTSNWIFSYGWQWNILETENVFRTNCVNRTQGGWNPWNLAFPVFTLTCCMEYVWKSSLWIGIRVFQRATQRPRILLTDNIESGGSCSVNYITNYWVYWYPDHPFQAYYKGRQLLLQSATAYNSVQKLCSHLISEL